MDPNAHRSESRRPGADAYWQRRFFTLLAGLGVIGLLAWACSGMVSGGNSSHSSGSGRPSAAAYSTSTPTSPAATSPSPVASPTASPTTSAAATPTASPSPSVSSKAAQAKATPKATATGPTACPAADLVLTAAPSQASYGTKDSPAFQVDIVSTDTSPCTLDTGPAALRLEVRHGSSVAYNSGACLHGAKPHVISLRRGIPVITSMAWNKHQTTTGCATTVAAATNRTYNAVIAAGGAQSPRSSFRLTGTPATPRAAAPAAKKTTRASR
jgi:hypothetical protein